VQPASIALLAGLAVAAAPAKAIIPMTATVTIRDQDHLHVHLVAGQAIVFDAVWLRTLIRVRETTPAAKAAA
jgi:hypothetical protein